MMTEITTSEQWAQLKAQIETQLKWGASELWSNYDFEKLSDAIAEKTGVSLSVSTLKRIFGKVQYKSKPALNTLNALAQFLNHQDWRDFVAKNAENQQQEAGQPEPETPQPEPRKWNYRILAFTILSLISLSILGFLVMSKMPKYTADDFSFHSKTMLTKGLPNSVVFDFDASKASDQDSIFICQTWDIRRKVLVNKNDKHHSAIYYYPGYFRAKLMVGEQIVKEHDIQIKTDGWLGLVEAEWGVQPLYFKSSEILRPGGVEVNSDLLQKYQLALSPEAPLIRLFNQKDLKGILTNNFTFESELKNDFAGAANACQRMEVLLQAKDDILILPIVQKACVGDIYVAAFGHFAESKKADLSGFGTDPSQWTKLKIVCKNGLMRFYLNDKIVYKAQITHDPKEIVGVQCRFNGMGAVRNTWLEGESGRVEF